MSAVIFSRLSLNAPIALVVFLARRGRRITLLVPSIEFALALDADLTRYGVPTALLVGQSPDARRRHATRLAERIATLDSGGFGQTAPGAELLGTRCALAGFVSVPPPGFDFPHDRPPCRSLRQAAVNKDGKEGKERNRLCPLAVSCGRQRSSRRLASSTTSIDFLRLKSSSLRFFRRSGFSTPR
jgi:hypothetical protein